jgi:hypothetical protein
VSSTRPAATPAGASQQIAGDPSVTLVAASPATPTNVDQTSDVSKYGHA